MSNEVRSLIKQLKKNGCTVDTTGRHHKVYQGEAYVYSLVKTPSDHRSMKNTIADLKRMGLLPRKT